MSIANKNYQKIAQAIAFMRQHHLSQPDLATVAEHVGISSSYFQKLFVQWAGISPKRFSQYLTLEYAKSKIDQTSSILDFPLETGLSSLGRLHDLFVNLAAVSPSKYKAKGLGLQICYGIHDTPFGEALIATTDRGICHLQFIEPNRKELAEQIVRESWVKADIISDCQATQALCQQIFEPDFARREPLTVLVKGTNFQIQVWQALLKIPFGELVTYQTIAQAIARPTATRAVGTAIGRNPIAYLIPCHRVIRASGELGGYRWGIERKAAILSWEANYTQHHCEARL